MIWLKLWPYLAGAVLFGSLGAFSAHTLDGKRYAALELTFADYRTQATETALKAQNAAREALELQVEQAHKTTLANQVTLNDLTNQTTAIAADRDRLRRLFAAATRPAPGSHDLPKADDRPAAPEAPRAQSDGRFAGLLADAVTECRGVVANTEALISELSPQL